MRQAHLIGHHTVVAMQSCIVYSMRPSYRGRTFEWSGMSHFTEATVTSRWQESQPHVAFWMMATFANGSAMLSSMRSRQRCERFGGQVLAGVNLQERKSRIRVNVLFSLDDLQQRCGVAGLPVSS